MEIDAVHYFIIPRRQLYGPQDMPRARIGQDGHLALEPTKTGWFARDEPSVLTEDA
jgi:hypothetical protein